MRLELVTIGAELLLGFTIDTNAAFLARTLSEIGVEIVRRTTVDDEPDRIVEAVRDALDRTGAVITTGGLGPTADDRTRPAMAALFGRTLRMDEAVMAGIAVRFKKYGYTSMPASNSVQAMVPEGATVLDNVNGSAPGLWIEDERGRWVAMLPGVPHEMRAMATDVIVPMLTKRYGTNGPVVLSRTVRTTGIGESALAELLGEDGHDTVNGLPLAFLPGWEGVDLRVTAHDLVREKAVPALDAAEAKLRSHADRYVYGRDGENLAAVVLEMCRDRGLHIATAESCTGGMVGERITAIPGSSDVYVGGLVAYDDRVKTSALGVPAALIREHGAVSEPVARALAAGARATLGTEIGIGITGIAGPTGGTPDKPVGTVWVATDVNGDVRATVRRYLGDREDVRRRSAQASLDQVRRTIAGIG
jgi:nicotinamide-nucleotide amidase